MEKALKTTGWTLLDFEGKTLAEGLPTHSAAVVEILTDDGDRFEIRPDEGLGWRLWVTNRPSPLGKSVFFSLKDDEDEATAEIFAAVAEQAGRDWNGYGKTYRILTDADHAAELAEDDEDDEDDDEAA